MLNQIYNRQSLRHVQYSFLYVVALKHEWLKTILWEVTYFTNLGNYVCSFEVLMQMHIECNRDYSIFPLVETPNYNKAMYYQRN